MWEEERRILIKKKKKTRKGSHQNIFSNHFLMKGLHGVSSPGIHPISPSALPTQPLRPSPLPFFMKAFLTLFFKPQARNDLFPLLNSPFFVVSEVLISWPNFPQENVSWPLQMRRPLPKIKKKKIIDSGIIVVEFYPCSVWVAQEGTAASRLRTTAP